MATNTVEKTETRWRFFRLRTAVVLVFVALLSAFAGCYGIPAAVASKAPSIALRFNPYNSEALGKKALTQLKEGGVGVEHAERLSRRAISVNPTAAPAVRTMGLISGIRAEVEAAEQIMRHAQALSRRDSATQIWMIEQDVANNDIRGALRHYDIALTTSINVRNLLLPVLVEAISQPDVLVPLSEHLAQRPVWRQDFVAAMLVNAPDVAAAAELSLLLDEMDSPLSLAEKATLSNRLVKEHLYEEARRLFGRPENERLVSNSSFQEDEDGNPFNWRLRHDASLGSDMISDETASGLQIFAAPQRGGDVAQQLLLLPAGKYKIATTADASSDFVEARPYWTMRCAGGPQIASIDIDVQNGSATSTARFEVPANCAAQWLVLRLRPIEDDVDLLIRQVQITSAA